MTWLDGLAFSSVIVHTVNNGPSFRCNLKATYDDGIIVSDLVNLDEDPHVLEAGEQFIVREQIQRIQRLEG
jgi:hypothetical protein